MPLNPASSNGDNVESWELADSPAAAGHARGHLAEFLRAGGCAHIDDALVICSELVTNAVLHARSGPRLVLSRHEHMVRVEVHDQSPQAPHIRSDDLPGGLGLRIVDTISHQWGWTPTPDGKVVWATFPCRP